MRHDEPFYLDLHCLQKNVFWSAELKGLKHMFIPLWKHNVCSMHQQDTFPLRKVLCLISKKKNKKKKQTKETEPFHCVHLKVRNFSNHQLQYFIIGYLIRKCSGLFCLFFGFFLSSYFSITKQFSHVACRIWRIIVHDFMDSWLRYKCVLSCSQSWSTVIL